MVSLWNRAWHEGARASHQGRGQGTRFPAGVDAQVTERITPYEFGALPVDKENRSLMRLLHDLEQLDLENQSRIRPDPTAAATGAVCDVGREHDSEVTPGLHQRKRLGETGN